MEASSIDGCMRRRRAITLLNMITMQNVACPIMIVQRENGMPATANEDCRAIPVITPGRAIGMTTRNETELTPKKRYRATANAAAVPSTSATPVAAQATLKERVKASRTSWSCQATLNQRVEKCLIGQG